MEQENSDVVIKKSSGNQMESSITILVVDRMMLLSVTVIHLTYIFYKFNKTRYIHVSRIYSTNFSKYKIRCFSDTFQDFDQLYIYMYAAFKHENM